YCGLVAQKSRKEKSKKTSQNILNHILSDLFPPEHAYLQLGGNETVGMGWCRIKTLLENN
ncbi:MAG: type III-B CRISPR module RAMP protein Cmr4, partial [Thiomargarita sp.]|nr:type III-B CRISPR module RAMP protein Cmr4 [Thiomargarita sp.]